MNFLLILSTLVLLYLITFFCEIFTNAIENLGKSFKINDGALGSIFAAIGTALPETILPLIAVFGAHVSGSEFNLGKDIGRGAVLGSPFLLSTLAFFAVGLTVIIMSSMKKRTDTICIDPNYFQRDLRYFLFAYTAGVTAAFIPSYTAKITIGIFLLSFYFYYAVKTVKKYSCNTEDCNEENEEETKKLKFVKFFNLPEKFYLHTAVIQLLFSVTGLVLSSHYFVENIKDISSLFGISAMIISLFLAPAATELPETYNGILWSIRKKDVLAVSNISGAMVFQACIPMSVGIFFTDWSFNEEAVANVVMVYTAFVILFAGTMKSKCFSAKLFLLSGIPYLLFLIFSFLNLK